MSNAGLSIVHGFSEPHRLALFEYAAARVVEAFALVLGGDRFQLLSLVNWLFVFDACLVNPTALLRVGQTWLTVDVRIQVCDLLPHLYSHHCSASAGHVDYFLHASTAGAHAARLAAHSPADAMHQLRKVYGLGNWFSFAVREARLVRHLSPTILPLPSWGFTLDTFGFPAWLYDQTEVARVARETLLHWYHSMCRVTHRQAGGLLIPHCNRYHLVNSGIRVPVLPGPVFIPEN